MFDGNGYHLAHYFSPPAHFGQGHGQQVHGQQVQQGHGQQYQQQFYPPTAPPMLLSVSMGDPMGSMAVPMGSMGGSLGSIPGGPLPRRIHTRRRRRLRGWASQKIELPQR